MAYCFRRTENYLGAALLHSAFNLAGAVGILIVSR
jgi:membrane protease YdiL (CAAX protease family)